MLLLVDLRESLLQLLPKCRCLALMYAVITGFGHQRLFFLIKVTEGFVVQDSAGT